MEQLTDLRIAGSFSVRRVLNRSDAEARTTL